MLLPRLFCLALLSAAAAPVAAQSREEGLRSDGTEGRVCSAGSGWCLGFDEADGPFVTAAGQTLPLWEGYERLSPRRLEIWPRMVSLSETAALVGVVEEAGRPYSGGFFEIRWLHLFAVDLGESASSRPVAVLPLEAEANIRACFSEADSARRSGACHDIYTFAADLGFAPGGEGLPDLAISTRATRYPAEARRNEDNSALDYSQGKPPETAEDPACSYELTYRFDAAQSRYLPLGTEPDCAEFLEP